MDFFPLTVCDIRKETEDITLLTLKPTSDQLDRFRFVPGQFLIVRVEANGKDERRAYSICNRREDEFLRIAVKHIDGGVFSTYVADELTLNDTLWVHPPDGRFLGDDNNLSAGEALGVAAGSGITPILSVMHATLESSKESRFTLFYGNRSANSIAFRSEIAGLKNTYMDRLRVYHVLSRESGETELLNGRLDGERLEALLNAFCPQPVDRVFVCGPEELMLSTRAVFLKRGLKEPTIRMESFGNYAKKAPARRSEKSAGRVIAIKSGGRTSTVNIQVDDVSILDAALEQGIDLPFACKGGICATCRCRVVSGTVEMDRNLALSQEELDDGMILSCRALPTSDKVELDFDV